MNIPLRVTLTLFILADVYQESPAWEKGIPGDTQAGFPGPLRIGPKTIQDVVDSRFLTKSAVKTVYAVSPAVKYLDHFIAFRLRFFMKDGSTPGIPRHRRSSITGLISQSDFIEIIRTPCASSRAQKQFGLQQKNDYHITPILGI